MQKSCRSSIVKSCLCLGITVLIMSCWNSENKSNSNGSVQSNNYTQEDCLKIKILKGDTTAYLHFRDNYVDKDYTPEFLVWALIMANKYHYSVGNYDVYFCFQQINAYYGKDTGNNSLKLLDSTTRAMAISYLAKAESVGVSK